MSNVSVAVSSLEHATTTVVPAVAGPVTTFFTMIVVVPSTVSPAPAGVMNAPRPKTTRPANATEHPSLRIAPHLRIEGGTLSGRAHHASDAEPSRPYSDQSSGFSSVY